MVQFRIFTPQSRPGNDSVPPRARQALEAGVLVAALLACGLAVSRNGADPDLWGHVQYGRDLLAHGLPATTTYSYVAADQPWINHEILAELALAVAADAVGPVGLLTLKCMLGVAVVGWSLVLALRGGVGLFPAAGAALLVAAGLGDHWSVRPQLASYVSFALLLGLLRYAFAGWEGTWRLPCFRSWLGIAEPSPLTYSVPRLKWLWLGPPLFALWANAHGGFLAGLCVLIAYLGLRGVEAWFAMGRRALGLSLRLAMMAAVACLATLLNPYGPAYHAWLYDDLKVPRPEIVEWRSPDLASPLLIPFVLLVVLWLACLIWSRRERDFTQQTILGLLLWQALAHQRHIAFFVLAFAFWMPPHVASLLARLGIGCDDAPLASSLSPRQRWLAAGGLAGVIGLLSLCLLERLREMPVARRDWPVSAIEFLADRQLLGRTVVTFNWAQYALAALGSPAPGPGACTVQVDGRCRTAFSQAQLDEHFDFLLGNAGPEVRYRDPLSPPFDPTRVLRTGEPDLVLLSRRQLPAVRVMRAQEDWALLYQDELAQVWGRRAVYDDPASPSFLPPELRHVSDDPQRGSVNWPAFPSRAQPPLLARDAAAKEARP